MQVMYSVTSKYLNKVVYKLYSDEELADYFDKVLREAPIGGIFSLQVELIRKVK